MLTRTDARGVTRNNVYDALNRLTATWFTDSTPAINYGYDSVTRGVGRLAYIYDGGANSTTDITGYDALGHPTGMSQKFYSNSTWQTFNVGYTYDLAGHVKSMTYPSGRTTTYTFDSAGRTSDFIGTLGDGTNRNYSTGITYSSLGGLAKEQFGTDTAVYNKLFYNIRGQLSEIRDSTSYTGPTDTSWNREAIINHYSDQFWGMCAGHTMTDNNGTVKKQDN